MNKIFLLTIISNVILTIYCFVCPSLCMAKISSSLLAKSSSTININLQNTTHWGILNQSDYQPKPTEIKQISSLKSLLNQHGLSVNANTSNLWYDSNIFNADRSLQSSGIYTASKGQIGFLFPLLLDTPSPSSVLFYEDFSGNPADRWQIVDNCPIASSWKVSNNKYVQTRRIESTRSFDGTYHLGSYSFLTIGTDFTDYEFSVEATYKGQQLQDDIGVMFRYQDDDNYYRVTLNGRYGFCRFEKKENGKFTTLGINARGYKKSETLHIMIRVEGSILQVFVNGDSVFNVIDHSHKSGTIALYTQDYSEFGNILVKKLDTNPKVTISNPLSHTVYRGNNLTASAYLTGYALYNQKVKFILNDSLAVIDYSPPFTAEFPNVESGENIIKAILFDDDVPVFSDHLQQVGTGGDYYVTVGDSITNGAGDYYTLDNISSDLRIISTQGFQANLNNLLTKSLGYPHIVFNEGIGGDKSYQTANVRISSILERHPRSNNVLILLGTNDSGSSLPPVTPSAFRKNMQKLINAIPSEKSIWVALVPPVFNYDVSDPMSDPRNADIIQKYNDEIVNNLSGINIGPDFFGFFLGDGVNRSSLFSTRKHPNALGHTIMAYLWNNVLTGQNLLPLFVDSLSPDNYKQNLLEEGNICYVDENYVLTGIPAKLKDGVWIMTANADRQNNSQEFLSFTVDRPVDVYVAYDSSANQLPEWLSAFDSTDIVINTNGISDFNVYKLSNVTGRVSLGGNQAEPAHGVSVNYLVILKEK